MKHFGWLDAMGLCLQNCDLQRRNFRRRCRFIYAMFFLLSLLLQFCIWCENWAEGGCEEALASFSVDHPRQENIQRAAATEAHEAWKRKTCLFLSLKSAFYGAACWQWFLHIFAGDWPPRCLLSCFLSEGIQGCVSCVVCLIKKEARLTSATLKLEAKKVLAVVPLQKTMLTVAGETPGDGPADKTLQCFSTSPLLVIHAQTSAKS